MQEALKLYPEWNGDWTMPANLRKAEIDIRNGALIRELDALATASRRRRRRLLPRILLRTDPNSPYYEPPVSEPKEIYVTNVPPEFRRIEFFVAGTVPNRSIISLDDPLPTDDDPAPRPDPSPSPVTGTWQEGTEPPRPETAEPEPRNPERGTLSVMICPLTGMRATVNCPDKQAKSFRSRPEPREFCSFHR